MSVGSSALYPLPTAASPAVPDGWLLASDPRSASTVHDVSRHKRFGAPRSFMDVDVLPPRPSSAASMAPCGDAVEQLMLLCNPAIDDDPRVAGSLKRYERAHQTRADGVVTRPASAVSVNNWDDVNAHLQRQQLATAAPCSNRPSWRPSSALSVSTRDINDSVGTIMETFAVGDLSRQRPKPRSFRRSTSAPYGGHTFQMTQLPSEFDDEEFYLMDDERERSAAPAEQPDAKPVPYFLTKTATWTRLWRTKADKEREILASRQALVGAQRSSSNHKSYAAAAGPEHEEALLAACTVSEKISLLRKDAEKRRSFSRACEALEVAKRRAGIQEMEERKARTTALMHSVSSREPAAQQGVEQHQQQRVRSEISDPRHSGGEDDCSAEQKYFAAASQLTHSMEKHRRFVAAEERCQTFKCAKLIRAAEDVERVDVMRSKHFTDVQVELRVNAFATAAFLAVHMGALLAAATKRLQMMQHQAAEKQQPAPGAATSQKPVLSKLQRLVRSCAAVVHLRQQLELRVSARAIWFAWLRCRAAIRRRRRAMSIHLIKRYIMHRRETTKFVLAVNQYIRAVKYMQSRWRGTLLLRGLRRDLALRQVSNFLSRMIEDDTQKAKLLKGQCKREECEIANRKGVPRLIKSQLMTKLRQDTEAEITNCQVRARQAEALREAPDILVKLVDSALEKRHREYHQQVVRFAKAVAQYDRDIAALRGKGVVVIRRRRNRGNTAPTSSRLLSSESDVDRSTPRRAGSLSSAREHTAIASQLDALAMGKKIFVEEPTAFLHHGVGSTISGNRQPAATARGGTSKHANTVWSILKERGIISYIPVRPIIPFFHAVFHKSEMVHMVEVAPV